MTTNHSHPIPQTLWILWIHRNLRRNTRVTKIQPIVFGVHSISISNLYIMGLFSTERGKRDIQNEIQDWDLRLKKLHCMHNRLYHQLHESSTCVAVCCSVLQCVAVYAPSTAWILDMSPMQIQWVCLMWRLQNTVTHCNTHTIGCTINCMNHRHAINSNSTSLLKLDDSTTATHCNTLQHTAN